MDYVIRCFGITLLLLGFVSLDDARCPTNLSNITFAYIVDPDNCQNYWICNGNVEQKLKCPTDYCFDPTINECTFKADDDCQNNETLLPDYNNCTRYWQCSNGRKVHMNCPNYPNLWFNYETKECDYISKYPALHGCGDIRCTEGPDRKKYIVNNDKKKFIWCVSGKAVLYKCCEDHERCHFDVNHQLCDFSEMHEHDEINAINKEM